MGEVWRAKDTKLGREVAIKTLPEEFAKDADRLARFEREAKLLASLNHPNIAAIHGFEEDNGTHFLVLELVEGDTLADQLKHGAIPVEESLKLAVQIAEALEAAHEKGVIHRDLKPANIKVTDDGKVKVLDFGLAKAFEGDAPDASVSNSPTLSMAATQQGTILGTAAYMSPEQARGKTVDKRADVWAFGVVLYESLTGKQAFADDDVSMTLSRVLQREPDFDALPASLSPTVNTYIRRCIEKDPKQRVRDVGDVRLALEGAFDAAGSKASDDGEILAMDQAAGWRYATSLALAYLAAGSLITGLLVWNLSRPDPQVPIRFTINTDPVYTSTVYQDIAISPDGQRIAYMTGGDEVGLNVRTLDQFAPVVPLGDASCCHGPFFSPDGQWVGFVDLLGAELRRIRVDGGPTVTISDLEGHAMTGATWGDDDTIIFSTAEGSGLWQVPAAGGDPEPLTTTDAVQGELNHLWPEILPGGEAVLFPSRA